MKDIDDLPAEQQKEELSKLFVEMNKEINKEILTEKLNNLAKNERFRYRKSSSTR